MTFSVWETLLYHIQQLIRTVGIVAVKLVVAVKLYIKYGNVETHFFPLPSNRYRTKIEYISLVSILFNWFLEENATEMSQNQESNTWSATDAKDNQQEIAKMVSKVIHRYISASIF